MPFTFAHPALAVPLRRHASLSALVIGSVVPDAGHFLPWMPPRDFTHSGPGLILFCLPMGWLIYLLFHHVLRDPLVALGPPGLAARLPARPVTTITPKLAWSISLGLVLGAITHLTWDFCTAIDTDWPDAETLMRPLFSIDGFDLYPQDILRHGSAVIGIGLLVFWARRWWDGCVPQHSSRLPLATLPVAQRLGFILITLIGIAAFALVAASNQDNDLQGRTLLTRAVRATLPPFTLITMAYSLVWQLWRRKSEQSASRRD